MNRGRRAWWDERTHEGPSEIPMLTPKDHSGLNAALDRIRCGYSAFDTEVHAPRRARPYRSFRASVIPVLYSARDVSVYTRTIDHSP